MKIGIISDTHENMPLIARAVEIFNNEKTELVLHAGDIISPITFKEFKNLKCKLIAVYGNNDGERKFLSEKFSQIGEIHNRYYETEIEGNKVLLMHEPDLLESIISSQKYDVVIYGHTHKIDQRTEGKTLVLNPGECGGWLTGKSTIALLELPSKKVRLIEL
ncbi:MAG: metallophosphoesterase [Endomicrobiia bacterium]